MEIPGVNEMRYQLRQSPSPSSVAVFPYGAQPRIGNGAEQTGVAGIARECRSPQYSHNLVPALFRAAVRREAGL